MRLLEITDGCTFSPKEFRDGDSIPAYAILSHTWGSEEVTFQDLIKDSKVNSSKVRASIRRLRSQSSKAGYAKIYFCAQQAQRDDLRYFWVDTCCINKQDPTELGKAINSMFRWYKNAAKCYVYLADVSNTGQEHSNGSPAWLSAFKISRWFTRGWTLQELLAPSIVEFYSKEGTSLGNRSELQRHIHTITKIPVQALSGASLRYFSVEERLSWVEGRNTTCEEDKAYSMLGIFGVYLPLIYGEGYTNALGRLRKEITLSQERAVDRATEFTRVTSSTVPFQRDNDFITRDGLDKISGICAKPGARAALVGLGGVGKSQIAVEYTFRLLDESPPPWVFWIHAETQARFKEGYRTIAETVKMDGWNDPNEDWMMRLVRTWLCDASNGRWVMVVDNADDANVFLRNATEASATNNSGLPPEPLINFLPRRSPGSILITSRSSDVAYTLTGTENTIVEVGPMSVQDAFTLLNRKLGHSVHMAEATTLINALDSMPLALTQAAAFINRRKPRMSVSKYVKRLRQSDRDRASLLEVGMQDDRRDAGASNSIVTTWHISFIHIHEQCPSAARLLSLMSFFDRQSIPESLLQDRYSEGTEGKANFEYDIYTLISFSLVKPSANGSSFDMHALVQFSMKKWLETRGELEYWKAVYATLLNDSYPLGESENWSVCRALLPHAQAALDNHPSDGDALEAWASLSFNVGWYVGDIGKYYEAYKHVLASYDVREILLGPDDPETIDSLNSLGLTLKRLGKHEEAKGMLQKSLEAKQREPNSSQHSLLVGMINLALLHIDLTQWDDAEKLLLQVLDTCSKPEMGPDNPSALDASTLLATVYRDRGRWTDAAELEIRILKAREAQLGPDHLTTLVIKSNLALTYRMQNRLKDAERMQLEVLEVYEKKQGSKTELLNRKADLAATYKAQGRLDDAEKLELQILDTSKKELGPDHFGTMSRMSKLATTYWKAGKLDEALELDLQTLELRKKNLGEDHLTTLDSRLNLAMVYRSSGHLDKAETLAKEALGPHIAKLGEDHEITLNTKVNLAGIYRNQGRFSEAEELEDFILRTRVGTLGPDHKLTLDSMINLSWTYKGQGRVTEAIKMQEDGAEGYEKAIGPDCPQAVACRKNAAGWRSECEQSESEVAGIKEET